MNFFSHFLYEYPESVTPYQVSGLILPDLIDRFNTRFRPLIRKVYFANHTPESEIYSGIYAHWEADKWFHNSKFFKEMNDFVFEQLKNEFPKVNRKFFLSHIAVELYLDKVLIEQNTDLLVEYYQLINQVEKPFFENFLLVLGKSNRVNDIWERFCRYRSEQYLMYYTDNEKILQALSNLYFRSINEQPSFSFEIFSGLIRKLEKKLQNEHQTLFP